MEGGDELRVASARIGSSRIWRSNGFDGFSGSSRREEDEEEELKWAAIEKLPTFLRMSRGILSESEGQPGTEIHINKLGSLQRKDLVERLVKIAEEDNEKFLLKLRERIDRVGLDIPTIEVRFEHLNVEAEAHVGSRALPTNFNFCINLLEGSLNDLRLLPSRKKQFTVLHDVSGIIKPRRMTLLLGPPSSGKTTLLLALAGRLSKDLKLSGRVAYNGHGMEEFVPQRTSAYISQYDLHIGEMTVRETLAFSARCQGIGSRYEMLAELSRREKASNIKPDPDIDIYMKAAALEGQEANVVTDYILKILGLEVCADTMVGDDMIRGISGGQKKRVTTGEMLVGPARALFMDEISTGLDSSTTFQMINSLRQSIHILNGTAVISLLQPAPETYELFDDIILLSDGQIVYQGPRDNVLEFFEFMGFKCPERKGVADFLQEVTSRKDQEQYWANKDEPYSFITVKEFSDAFQSFHIGQKLGDELATPFDTSKGHPAVLTKNKYGVSKKELLKACVSREFLLMKRNSFVYIFKMWQLFFMAFITMTLFLRTEMHRDTVNDGGIYMGALFFTLIVIMFNGSAEINMTIVKLPVFYKQRELLFYPSWAYSLPTWILKIPITIIEVGIWVIMTYYVIGFDPNFERFIKQYFLLVCINQTASGLFRFMGAVGRNIIVANTFGSFALLALMALGGFVLSRVDVKKWWLWGYWVSPMMYAQNALAVNEFLGKSWAHVPPNSTQSLGVQVLKARGFFPEAYWYWIGVGACIGYMLLFNFLFPLALQYLNPFDKPQALISEEALAERNAVRKDHIIELSSTYKGSSDISRRNVSSRTLSARVGSFSAVHHSKKRGMVLPFTPLSITFDEIRYAVDMPQEMKAQGFPEDQLELLKGVNGAFRPGVLTALMGVSGAGKTTLMDVLSGRKTTGYVQGQITISGHPKKQETFARISGYCEQTDIHSPHVTVYESLVYSAWLRLPPEVDSSTRQMFIEEVMELVELTSLREALVGLPGVNGLSTEQRKRLTVAVELVANPSIIFMDEPTSGLDARAAAIVMRTVRNTVDTGRTVVCTIHQPSIDIFDAFDELILLKRGGEEIYVGPLGQHCSHLINYFEGINGVPKIRNGYNPATWMLEITSEAQEAALGVNFAEIYKNSDLYRRNKDLIRELSTPLPGSKDLYFPTTYSQTFLTQCMACLWKQRLSYWRNPPYSGVRFLFTTFIALMFGTIFWDIGSKSGRIQDLFNAMGSMYAAVLFIGVSNATSVQPIVAIERTVFYRERAAGMYSALPYAFGQIAIEIPYIFIQTAVYGIIVYAMIGFEWTASKFFWYLFFMFFTFLYFTFYGMMAVGATPDQNIAAITSFAFYLIWNLFSGFIIPQKRMPIWWRWYFWICPVSWTLYGLVTSQYGDVQEHLETGETVQEFLFNYFGYRHDFIGVAASVLVGFTLLFGFTFAFSIKTFNFQKR
ncbi:PREDICTED: pleiotropic drug resistance protein 1-like isoform X2 [Lupinus angustifolius]|uniref:pleiotropic drug resistance protein 1-like isoform X2 n=1 Tax=Lupinus angustifolius TaxID=3871 RepID=UPI00092FCE5B|nr:PREDICTED: pleiotropic drug resistance protein 1-like isoform X2 [Lupinus angustifolius]